MHSKATAQDKWLVLLDAAAFVPTQPLNLSEVEADFVTISFYKVRAAWVILQLATAFTHVSSRRCLGTLLVSAHSSCGTMLWTCCNATTSAAAPSALSRLRCASISSRRGLLVRAHTVYLVLSRIDSTC